MSLLVSALVFLAVVAAVAGVVLGREGAAARLLGARLRRFGLRGETAEAGIERDVRYSSIPWFDRLLRAANLGERLELLLYQAGMKTRPGVIVLLTAVCLIGGYVLGVVLFHRVPTALLLMLVAGPLPLGYAAYRKHTRMKAFAREFPDALDLLVSALRAGLSFSAAMQIVAEESPDPVRGEFAVTVEEQSLGIDFREAMVNLTRRVDSLDLRFFVTAVLLQRDTGGNLAELIQTLANLIREKFKFEGKVRTLSAEGKLSAVILAALPFLVGGWIWLTNPKYLAPLVSEPFGRVLLLLAAAFMIAGILIMKRMVNIKV